MTAAPGSILESEPHRIHLFRPQNQLGDLLLNVPAIRAIRERYPRARITLVVGRQNAAAVLGQPWADEVRVVEPGAVLGLVRAALPLGERPDLAIYFTTVSYSKGGAFLVRASRARDRIGFDPARYGRRDHAGLTRAVPYPEQTLHQSEVNAILAAAVGAGPPPPPPHYVPDPALAAEAPGGVVYLHPGAGKVKNRWPAERFGAIARELVQRGLDVQWIEGPQDEGCVLAAARSLGGRSRSCEASRSLDSRRGSRASLYIGMTLGRFIPRPRRVPHRRLLRVVRPRRVGAGGTLRAGPGRRPPPGIDQPGQVLAGAAPDGGAMRYRLRRVSLPKGVWSFVAAACFLASAVTISAPAASAEPAKSAAALLEDRNAIAEREGARDTTGLAVLLLENESPKVRAAAAVALGRIQNPGSAPALALALADKSLIVRREAAFALGLVGDSTASSALVLRLTPEVDPTVRESIVTALGMLGARSAGPALARSLRAAHATERWAAALAGARARDSSLVQPLSTAAKDARPEMRWRVAYALGRIGDRESAPALRKLSTDKVEIVRYSAARLGEVGDSSAAPRLVALTDPSWRV
jgi:ADP-heptose:LPS heptosyltransferase